MIRPRTEVQKRILEHLATLPLDSAAQAYLERRGLAGVAERFRFGSVPLQPAEKLRPYAGRLVIPSIAPGGNVYDVAFRCIEQHDCKEVGCPKYLFLSGLPKRVYNTRALADAGEVLEITEGQLNAASLEAAGLHAIGVPAGAGSWKPYFRRMLQDFPRIRVWPDGDEAGKKLAGTITVTLPTAEVMMVPSGKDVNDILIEQGPEGILRIANGENDSRDETAGWGLPSPTAEDQAADSEPEEFSRVHDWPHDSEPPPF